MPLSLKSSAKDLQTKASYAVYAMLAIGWGPNCQNWRVVNMNNLGIAAVFFWVGPKFSHCASFSKTGALEVCCAFIHGIFQLVESPVDYEMVGSNIKGGLFDMALAFGGIAILPYVLAETWLSF